MKRVLTCLALLCVLSGTALAKPTDGLLMQTHVNLTMSCQDLPGAAQRLQTLAVELGGLVTNANLQLESGSASATLRIPPTQVTAFLAKAHALGDVQNENVSVSDNTRSWEEARANLELAEQMAAVNWAPQGGRFTPQQRFQFETEFKTYLRDRINSTRSNLANYEDYRRWAEVSVNLSGAPKPLARPVAPNTTAEPAITPAATPAAVEENGRGPAWLIVPSIFLGVCLAYFMFSRRPHAPGT